MRKFFTLIEITLILLICFFVFNAWKAYQNPPITFEVTAPIENESNLQHKNNNYDILTSFDPFHRKSISSSRTTNLPVTKTGPTPELTLKGVRQNDSGSAVISINGEDELFQVGEPVTDQYTLNAVHIRFVELISNAQSIHLYFNDPESNSQSGISDMIPKSWDNFHDKVFLKRILDGNEILGFEVKSRSSNFSLRPYDLQNGDIITHINDIDIRARRPDFGTLFNALPRGQKVTLQILRNNQATTIESLNQ